MRHIVFISLLNLIIQTHSFTNKSQNCDIHIDFQTKEPIMEVKKIVANVIKDKTNNGYYMKYCISYDRFIGFDNIIEVHIIFRNSKCQFEDLIFIDCSFLQKSRSMSCLDIIFWLILFWIFVGFQKLISIRWYHNKYLKNINYNKPFYIY
jgi:hypothetical protein